MNSSAVEPEPRAIRIFGLICFSTAISANFFLIRRELASAASLLPSVLRDGIEFALPSIDVLLEFRTLSSLTLPLFIEMIYVLRILCAVFFYVGA